LNVAQSEGILYGLRFAGTMADGASPVNTLRRPFGPIHALRAIHRAGFLI
jgi:hypothetical protein